MFSILIEIDDSWISQVYDHVHHGRILSLFEEARLAFVASKGFPNDKLMQEGKVIVVTHVDVAYNREVRAGKVVVTCEDVVVEGRTIKIRQRVLNSNQKVAVEAVVSLMFMDMQTRRGMAIPDGFIL